MANSYVVDIQGFDVYGNFIPKELCVVSVESTFVRHRMIGPPTHYQRLSPQLKKQVNFVTNHIHGLYWDQGYALERDVLDLLRELLKYADKVFIKGSERVNYLKNLLKNISAKVIDLDINSDVSAYFLLILTRMKH